MTTSELEAALREALDSEASRLVTHPDCHWHDSGEADKEGPVPASRCIPVREAIHSMNVLAALAGHPTPPPPLDGWIVPATAKGVAINVDEWGRSLYVFTTDRPHPDAGAIAVSRLPAPTPSPDAGELLREVLALLERGKPFEARACLRTAILDRSTAAPGLDVERLTEALFQIHHVLPWRWWDGADVTGTSVEFAREIARQYARLAPAEPSALHGFTCGLCQWGRDSVHEEAAYRAHMAHVHPSAEPSAE
jgi:hypothetical protein